MLRTLPILVSAILVAGVSGAQADVKTACASDVKSYCSGVEPKGGKLRDCMAEHRAKLSDTCKIAVADRLLERQAKKAESKDKKPGSGLAPKDDDE